MAVNNSRAINNDIGGKGRSPTAVIVRGISNIL